MATDMDLGNAHLLGETGRPLSVSGLGTCASLLVGFHLVVLCARADTQVVTWGNNTFGQTSVPAGLTNAVALAAGSEHSLALKADGTVAAWGMNYYGELNFPGDLTNAVAISAGGESSYALKSDGAYNACGYYAGNQNYLPGWIGGNQVMVIAAGNFAGLSLMADDSVSAFGDLAYYIGGVPPRLTNVVAIAAGWSNGVALINDGTAVEWTVDSYSFPGVPSPVPGISNLVAISAGYYHRAGLRGDGTVVAWGNNSLNQTDVPAGLSNMVAISCGGTHTLALKSDGTVIAWGDNSSHQCNVPGGLTNVIAIAGGGAHSLAIVSPLPLPPQITTPAFDQIVLGNNTAWLSVGAAGLGPFRYQWSQNGTPIPGATNPYLKLENVQRNAAGNYSVSVSNLSGIGTNVSMILGVNPWIYAQPSSQSALAGNTAVFTSSSGGLNPGNYQWLFNGTNVPNATNSTISLTNVQLNQAGSYAVSISNAYGMLLSTGVNLSVGALNLTVQPKSKGAWFGSSNAFTVAASGTGPISYQWQFNGTNLSSPNASSLVFTSVRMSDFGSYDVIVSNPYGALTSSVATLSFSQVADWGANSNLPPILTNVLAIAGEPCVLHSNGVIHWWNPDGYWTVFSTGGVFATSGAFEMDHLALMTNGNVNVWSSESNYVLPNSVSTNAVAVAAKNPIGTLILRSDGTLAGSALSAASTLISNLNNVVAISEGERHCLVLTADGNLFAWGDSFSSAHVTTIPSGLSNIVAIAAGMYHNIALKADGTLVSWGFLPNGKAIPSGLSNVVAIAAGRDHSMALRSDGTVVSWGTPYGGLTNVPAGLTNVVAIAASAYDSLALIGSGPLQTTATITGTTVLSNGFSFLLPTESGRVYALEYRTNLTDPTWIALPLVAGTGRLIMLQDRSAATNSQRFYRVRRW